MSVGSVGSSLNAYSAQSVGTPATQTTTSAVTNSKSVVVAISAKATKATPSSIDSAVAAYQAAAYAGTLDRLGPISISDTSANFGANFAILADMASRSKITSIKLTDKNASITTTAQALGNLADSNSAGAKLLSTLESKLIVKLQNISASVATTLKSPTKNVDFQFSISDSAIAITNNLDAISTLSKKKGALSSIIISGANNILSLSAAQLKNSANTLSLISNNYALNVNGATTKDISTLEKNTNITSISITDSASNVLKSAAVLKASSKGISSIILNDTKDVTLSINQAKTLASFDNVTMASAGYTISDEALTVIAHIRYDLHDIISGAKTVSINDKKPANLTVSDSLALRSITNLSPSVKYNIVDTVDAITLTNSEATSAMDAAETITVSGTYTIEQAKAILGKKKLIKGTPITIRDTVSNILAESQKANFGTLANALTVTVSDTAANVASNIDRLQKLAEKNAITIINLNDNSTQTLSLTSDQWSSNVEAIGKISSRFINPNNLDSIFSIQLIPTDTVNEGSSFIINVTALGIEAGYQIPYEITGVSASDIDAPLTGILTVDANGRATKTVNILSDSKTEGKELLSVSVINRSISKSIEINDTSTTPAFQPLTQANITNASTQFYWSPAAGGNGHIYEFVNTDVTWDQALLRSKQNTLGGYQGYLVTITSQSELAFIGQNMNKISVGWDARDIWIALSDQDSEGTWKWMDGPEQGTIQDLRSFGFTEASYAGWQTYVDWMSVTTGYQHNQLGFQPLDQGWFKGGTRTGLNSSAYSRSFYGNGYVVEYGTAPIQSPSTYSTLSNGRANNSGAGIPVTGTFSQGGSLNAAGSLYFQYAYSGSTPVIYKATFLRNDQKVGSDWNNWTTGQDITSFVQLQRSSVNNATVDKITINASSAGIGTGTIEMTVNGWIAPWNGVAIDVG